MFSRYRHMSVVRQIVLASSASLLVIFSILTLVVTQLSERSALQRTEQSLAAQANAMKLQLNAYYENAKVRGGRSTNMFHKYLGCEISQGSGLVRTGDMDLPEFKCGTQTLNANHHLLEDFKAMTGDEAAVLWVSDGKVFRVATMLKKDGKPMDGTQIPADDPLSLSLQQGKDHAGLIVRNGQYFFSSVKALRSTDSKSFIALSNRVDLQPELKQLRSMFGSTLSGETGYSFIMRPTGKEDTLAEFVMHPKLEGKTADAASSAALREVTQKMLATKEGVLRYSYPDENGVPQQRVVALAVSPGWGWVIGTGSWLDEYLAEAHRLRNLMIIAGVLAALLATALTFLLVRSRLKPLSVAVQVALSISSGRLDSRIEIESEDEIGALMNAMQKMQNDLRGVVADIQTAVASTVNGDFTRQADLSGKHGFGLEISQSLNILNANLLRQIGGNPADAVQIAARIAAGDLGSAVNILEGDTQSILAAMSKMQTSLAGVIHEVHDIVTAATEGNFSRKMATAGTQGYSRTLGELLNQLSNVTEAGLQDVMRVAQAISEGDLTQTISKDYPGLFGQLKDAINTTVEGLQDVVGNIREATDAINVAAREIAAGNQDLSSRTEEQASSLDKTSTSMEQLNKTVRQNADNAREATELAKTSNAIASKGGDMTRRVVLTMNDIQGSSKKIVDIISVIDSIAFQTNILALNAAVEAARAGEQGRGFAVVATEVRNLAQRSATAAKEIKTLIAESVDKVEGGARLVQEAGSNMDDVVASFQKVATLVIQIADASKSQSGGIEQVTKSIAQMDEVTQQNAALVEEAAAAAESLEDQAKGLVKAVAMFKLGSAARQGDAPLERTARAENRHKSSFKSVPRLVPAKPLASSRGSQDEWDEY